MRLPISRAPLALALALAAASPVWAQTTATDPATMPIEAVEEAYLSGDLETARAGLIAHAESGLAVAQYRLGYMMATGEGGPFDRAGAIRWLEAALAQDHSSAGLLLARVYLGGQPEEPDFVRAAELLEAEVANGSAEAGFYLSQLLRRGVGIDRDPVRAFELLGQSARAGVIDAQYALAQMYSRGEGIEKDDAQAARWLLSAAEAGQTGAMLSLHYNYARGEGFPQDDEKALFWLTAAAEAGNTLAERMLGAAYLVGEGVEADPIRGIAYTVRAAEKGDPAAQTNLGYAYATGTGVPQDDAKAAEWYTRAADRGLTRAALVMGQFYETGRGVDQNDEQAVRYYGIAFSGRNEVAAARLGILYVTGRIPVEEEPEFALDWVAASALVGHPESVTWLEARGLKGEPYANRILGQIYRDGAGDAAESEVEVIAPDPAKAAEHYGRAARAQDPEAQLQLALLYAAGSGVEQDFVEAHKWANVAAANGNEAAAERRDVFANLMTPEQIAEAQDRARRVLAGQ